MRKQLHNYGQRLSEFYVHQYAVDRLLQDDVVVVAQAKALSFKAKGGQFEPGFGTEF